MRRALVAALAAAALGGGAAVAWSDGPARVVAHDRAGGTVASLSLPSSGTFALAYRHSYYGRPAVERFRALPGGGFELLSIASPSRAVLDYYEADGSRARRGGWWTLRLTRPVRFREMPLAATAVGRRTLVAGSRRAPLWGAGGDARHLTIAVEGS
jgi:hypothetical protein